jgi:hypothetical protein
VSESPDTVHSIPPDLAPYSSEKPRQALHLLFIHHSCGGQLLADRGIAREKYPDSCIYLTHPNGGSLRTALKRSNYLVHEASYGSSLGRETDVCAWRAKFSGRMGDILACGGQDRMLPGDARNSVVIFKSCYPNSLIDAEGREPGDPDSPERTTANYKAAYRAILSFFAGHPETLFVAMTAPPMARPVPGVRGLAKGMIRSLLGRSDPVELVGRRARVFNDWLGDMDSGWLKGYGSKNVVVFDCYDILTGRGGSNWSRYPTGAGMDSHPNREGNTRAANAFTPFLNMAVRRAGL